MNVNLFRKVFLFLVFLVFVSISDYHLYGNFGEKFQSNGTAIFFGSENRNGIELCHLQNTHKLFALSRLEALH